MARRKFTGRGANMRIVGLVDLRKKMIASGDVAMAAGMNAMFNGMKEAADIARKTAPKDSGAYAASLRAVSVDSDTHTIMNTDTGVGIGKGIFLGRKMKAAIGIWGKWYGWFLEYGTVRHPARPHLRPAVRKVWKATLRKSLGDIVDRVSRL